MTECCVVSKGLKYFPKYKNIVIGVLIYCLNVQILQKTDKENAIMLDLVVKNPMKNVPIVSGVILGLRT